MSNNKNQEDYDSANAIDYYDIIINVDSLSDLQKGWEMKCSEKGAKIYQEKKNKRSCVVGIVGNGNKGKSFILQNLAGEKFPSGFSVRTEGLSVKYPTIVNKNIILLDSAGLETPLVDSEDFQLEEDTEESYAYQQIQLIARDKQLTEQFLQKFVIFQSDILIAVVGQLTYSDQKLLNRIKRDTLNIKTKPKHLYVMHNLMNLDKISQVKAYFDETLNKSLTFKLRINDMINLKAKEGEINTNVSTSYYTEIVKDKTGTIQSIVHLIMARQGTEAGNYYNESSLDFLRIACANYSNIDTFPILDKLKDHLITTSKDLLENPIKTEDVEIGDKTIYLKVVRDLEGNESASNKIQLKKCMVDELGISSFLSNAFSPIYRYYTTDSQLIIEIEIPGELERFKPVVLLWQDVYIFKVSGEKKIKEINSQKCKTSYSIRDSGKFVLDIRIPYNEINLKDRKHSKVEKKDGVITLYYEIGELETNDDDDIVKFS